MLYKNQMLISLLVFLIISNAVSLTRDKSILFSRIVSLGLIVTTCMAVNNLFNVTTLTHSVNILMLGNVVCMFVTACFHFLYPYFKYNSTYCGLYNEFHRFFI